MRELINILNEVTLSKYAPGQRFLISGGVKGQQFKDLLAGQGIDADGIITLTGTEPNNGPLIQMGRGDTVYTFQNEAGQFWTVAGSTSAIEAPFVHYKGGGEGEEDAKVANKGEIAEVFLAQQCLVSLLNDNQVKKLDKLLLKT